jgi:hypothetical protein
LGDAQSGSNWRLLMTYFSMIQLIENAGAGLVYGLRFYATGRLEDQDVTSYVKTNALVYEYYKQARDLVPADIGREIHKLFNSEDFMIVNTRCVCPTEMVSQIIFKILFSVLHKFWAM